MYNEYRFKFIIQGVKMKDEIKKLGKIILLCILICIFDSIVMAVLLRLSFWTTQKAFIARLNVMLLIASIILFVIGLEVFLKKKNVFGLNFCEMTLVIVASFCFMSVFATLGPMVIERSYTVYSLAYMTDHDEWYTYEDIRDQFVTGYVDGGATQMRIDEQISIGNIQKQGQEYRITQKGKNLIWLFRVLESIFPVPDKSSIYPKKY